MLVDGLSLMYECGLKWFWFDIGDDSGDGVMDRNIIFK